MHSGRGRAPRQPSADIWGMHSGRNRTAVSSASWAVRAAVAASDLSGLGLNDRLGMHKAEVSRCAERASVQPAGQAGRQQARHAKRPTHQAGNGLARLGRHKEFVGIDDKDAGVAAPEGKRSMALNYLRPGDEQAEDLLLYYKLPCKACQGLPAFPASQRGSRLAPRVSRPAQALACSSKSFHLCKAGKPGAAYKVS